MKSVTLKPIVEDNVLAAFALELCEEQKIFVSHPMRSLALGYVHRDHCRAFGIYSESELIGYVMILYDRAAQSYTLWHFMIDKHRQGHGYGRAALKLALDYIRTRPFGASNRILLTCHPDNAGALKLYAEAGFERTGHTCGAEIELKLDM